MLAINIISPTPTTAALPLDKAGINVCRSDQRDITKASQKASSPSRRVSEWTSLVREIELSTQALACAQDAPSPATFRYWMRQYADLYATLIERVLESSHSWNIHNITSATQAIRTAHSCILESTDKPLTPERLQRLFSEALMEIADLRLRILVIHTAVPASGPTEFLARLTCPPTHRRLNTTQATPSVLAASSAPSHAKVVMEVDPRFALMGAGERPRIRAATFAGMVQHLLTVGAVLDPEYETLFFVFLPSFADASTLVRSLIDAYAGACEDTRMQLRVGKVFLKWATQHWRPARDAVAEDAVRVFATGTLRADHPTLSYEVTAALDQLYLPKQRDRRRSRLSLLASSRPLPKPKALIVPRIFLPRLPARRRDVRPALHNLCAGEGRMQLARQLTYFAQERWQGVLPEDAVLHHFCGAAQDLRVGEHLKEITNCAARLGVWVRRSVANVEGERLARRAFKLWTSVAKHCFSMHNYYFGRTIIDVLKETCVLTHLKKAASGSDWDVLKVKMDSDLWPDALSSLGSTPTPMLPVPADLKAQIQAAQKHDALENSGEGLIDLAPFRTMTLVLHALERSRIPYPVAVNARLQQFIRAELDGGAFKVSLTPVEPHRFGSNWSRSVPAVLRKTASPKTTLAQGSDETLVGGA